MKLHRYQIGYVPFRLIESLKMAGEPFGLAKVIELATKHTVLLSKEVAAFTAEDALTQLRATEGGNFEKPPFVVTIEPLEDD